VGLRGVNPALDGFLVGQAGHLPACRVSITPVRLASLRWRSSLSESTPMLFEHRCMLGADALELGEVVLDSHDVSP
jgi:hypothetical protein